MTHRILISIPDEMKIAIDRFNKRNPYEKLNISLISQKAIFDKIKSIDPEALPPDSAANSRKTPESKSKAKELEEIITIPEDPTEKPPEKPKAKKKPKARKARTEAQEEDDSQSQESTAPKTSAENPDAVPPETNSKIQEPEEKSKSEVQEKRLCEYRECRKPLPAGTKLHYCKGKCRVAECRARKKDEALGIINMEDDGNQVSLF